MNILITGGTGSLGSALARKWHEDGHKLTLLSRCPHRQRELAKELTDARFVLSDICDYDKVRMACLDQDVLVHAAALKHIEFGQKFPHEFVKVNVLGTDTLIAAWGRMHAYMENPFSGALYISSDKAVEAVNLYGNSKAIGEGLWRNSRGSVLRYGNVVTSHGSFLEIWRELLRESKPLPVREPRPTRFFLTMDDAIELVQDALRLMLGGEYPGGATFVPHSLKAFGVADVAKALGAETVSEPLGPGEKQHETLIAECEAARHVTDLLSVVEPGYMALDDYREYYSETAEQMTGSQFLERVGWK